MNIIKKWNNISLVKRIIAGLAAGIILGRCLFFFWSCIRSAGTRKETAAI